MKGIKKIALAGAMVLMCGVFAGCSNSRPAPPTTSQLTTSIVAQPGSVVGVWQIDCFIDKDGKNQNIEDFVAMTLNREYGVVVERDSEQFQRAISMYNSIGIAFFDNGRFTSVVNVDSDAGRINGTYKVENGEVRMTFSEGKTGSYQYNADTDTLSQTVDGVTTLFKRAEPQQEEPESEVGSLVVSSEAGMESEVVSQ